MAKKSYDQLRFNDDFMFCKVMQNNPELCREVLIRMTDRDVGELVRLDRQNAIEITPGGRGVRFDVFAKDDESVIYDIEMQNAKKETLAKRVRYSQSMIDQAELERGGKFETLGHSLIVFICNFPLFKDHGLHRYTFRNFCAENKDIELGDEAEKIFLCTHGEANDVSSELMNLLMYISGGPASDSLTRRIDEAVKIAKKNPIWRKEYMDFQDYLDSAREEGREEGIAIGREEGRAEREEELEQRDEKIAQLEAEILRLKKSAST